MNDHQNKAVYIRQVDMAALAGTPDSERASVRLIDRDSGGATAQISYIRTPPGGGSPRGIHTHEVDQHFYIISGTMQFNVDGDEFEGGPGSLVYFPAKVPHQNWNAGTEPTVHLAINTPLPPEGKPLGTVAS